MKISASILSIKDNIKDNVKKLEEANVDYLHLDIMDGSFVTNKTWDINEINEIIKDTKKPLDVHLMVDDVLRYITDFSTINPSYITFHYETSNDHFEMIDYIKKLGIKVGMSIKPDTNVDDILDYLPKLDLVLVMSVEPGKGGQSFVSNAVNKINRLYQIREQYHFNYVIEVDGGINDETIKDCVNADIAVVGSFITNSNNYQEQINKLKRES